MDENKGLVSQRIFIIFLVLIMCGIVFGGYMLLKKEKPVDNAVAQEENISKDEVRDETVSNKVGTEDEENIIITKTNIIKNIENISDNELEQIAKKTLTEYIKYHGYEKSNVGPMPSLLVKLGLETEENLEKITKGIYATNVYIKSNTSYETFKNALLQYVTEDYFIKYFSQYRNIDGKVAFCNCAGSGPYDAVENVTLKSKENNKYKFEVVFKDLEMYDHFLDGEDLTEEDYLFNNEIEFEYVNERLVISKYNEQIILDGVYSMEASDVAYEFYPNGTVEYCTNIYVFKGEYTMNGPNELRIRWEEKTVWDAETSEETVKKMSGKEYVEVIDENNITVRTEVEGKTYSNDFIKFEN